MWHKIKPVMALTMVAIVFVLLWQGMHTDPRIVKSPLINKPVPKFSLPSVLPPKIQITNQVFHGQPTILNVFATSCVSCKTEHPVLMQMAQHDHVKVIGLDYKDKKNAANHWLKNSGNPYAIIIYDYAGDLAFNLGVYGTPETFLIDANGIIRYKYIGPLTENVWRHQLYPRFKRL